MQFSKSMIDLVYEIRRRVDAGMKPGVKLANPEMLLELAEYYRRSADVVTKALIKELLHLAGDQWAELIDERKEAPAPPKQTVKVYRGQVSLVDAPAPDEAETPPKPQRIYRGQIVTG